MANDIQADFDARAGRLGLWCGKDGFARLQDALAREIGAVPPGVEVIEIRVAPAPTPRLRDRVALVGCGMLAVATLFVVIVGLNAIAGWAIW